MRRTFLETVRRQRGLPFLKRGMRVELCYSTKRKQGYIVSGNTSGNIQVMFDGDKKSSNCHPRWAMTYYDSSGNIIAQFKD